MTATLVDIPLLDRISQHAGNVQLAAEAMADYVRMRTREDGFWRRIMPAMPVSNDELDRQIDTDKPIKVVDR